jgi:hypothetical protein
MSQLMFEIVGPVRVKHMGYGTSNALSRQTMERMRVSRRAEWEGHPGFELSDRCIYASQTGPEAVCPGGFFCCIVTAVCILGTPF